MNATSFRGTFFSPQAATLDRRYRRRRLERTDKYSSGAVRPVHAWEITHAALTHPYASGVLSCPHVYERVSAIGERESERAWKIVLDKFAPGMGRLSLLFQRARRMFFPRGWRTRTGDGNVRNAFSRISGKFDGMRKNRNCAPSTSHAR